jgi:phosphoribosylanthranilate isomerase
LSPTRPPPLVVATEVTSHHLSVALVATIHHQGMPTRGIVVITTTRRCITTAVIRMLINIVEPMSPITVTTKRLIKGWTTISHNLPLQR